MKIGGNAGMLSHWSRLIDLPIATLIAGFSLVMPVRSAEWLTHIVWPVTLLGALLWVVYRTTAKVAGETAARMALLLAVMCPFAYYQFAVGRIDHHNAMIAAAVSAVLLIWSYPLRTDVWRVAGVLTGLAVAIGYEALAPAVAIGAFVALWGLLDRRAAEPARAFALALALTFGLAFVATIPPSRWMDIRCDAISLNMVALVLFGTSGLAIAVGPGRDWPMAGRIAVIIAAAGAGLAIFGMLEPRCLAGPKGQLPPLLTKVWLDNVAENASFVSQLVSGDVDQSLGLLAFYLIGLAALAHQTWKSRAPADMFLLAASAAFTAFACWQYKFMSYASFLAIVPVAIAISRLGGFAEVSATTVRFAAIILSSQSLLLAASGGVDDVLGRPKIITEDMRTDANACAKPAAMRDLADLPPGLVAAAHRYRRLYRRADAASRPGGALSPDRQRHYRQSPDFFGPRPRERSGNPETRERRLRRRLPGPRRTISVEPSLEGHAAHRSRERRSAKVPDARAALEPGFDTPRLESRPCSTQSSAFSGRCISAVIASSTVSRPSIMPCTASAIGISTPFSRASRTSAADV